MILSSKVFLWVKLAKVFSNRTVFDKIFSLFALFQQWHHYGSDKLMLDSISLYSPI